MATYSIMKNSDWNVMGLVLAKNYFREISDLGHFGGGHIPMWVMDLKLFQCGSVWLYQTPALSNHSNLALSQTTAT